MWYEMFVNANKLPKEVEDSEIFSELYNRYFPKLFKYTLYKVCNIDVAEDLVSEVFEKVLLNYHTFSPEKGKFSTWLFTIANNSIINYLKRNGSKIRTATLETVELRYRFEDQIIDRELKAILLKAIMSLDERQKSIIALKFGACLTNRQIAQVLDLTESNVGTILYRSLRQLKNYLRDKEIFN